MMPNMIPPTKEEMEERFQEVLEKIKETSLVDFMGNLLESNDAQIQHLTNQVLDMNRQIAILQAEKAKMFELYRRVSG
jgi:hypothetical protein